MTAGDIQIRTGEHGDSFSGIVLNGVDDYLEIDAIAAYEAGANNVVGTISAWVNIPNITGTYAIFAIGVNAAISHINLAIKAGKLNVFADDAGTDQFDVIATTATITPHKWHHVAVVHRGDRPHLFLDGEPVVMTDTTPTDLTYWWNDLATWDKGAIGIINMNATLTNDFLGGISYVKFATGVAGSGADWTNAEVKQEYDYRATKGSGSGVTTGVLATWTLDNSLVETTTGGGTYDASIVSDAQFDIEYSQLTSKLRLLAPVIADDMSIVAHGLDGGWTAVVVKAA